MTFVSQLNLIHKGARTLPPYVVFRRKGSGQYVGAIGKAAGMHRERIDIEIDVETRRVRISKRPDGALVGHGGQFGCLKQISDIVGHERIYLTLKDDGKWYGNY